LTADEERAATPIKRYEREYFDLIDRHGKTVAKYLAIEGEVVLKLGDETYVLRD
jgi:hypothetical protein